MPDEAGLKRILKEFSEEERLELAAAALRQLLQPLGSPLIVLPNWLIAHLPNGDDKMPDFDGLVRVLRTLSEKERLKGAAVTLREHLRLVVERLNERHAAQKIERLVRQLGAHTRLLHKHGIHLQTKPNVMLQGVPIPTVYTDEMLAGNVLPEIYVVLTGKRPTVYESSPAVNFVTTVMCALGIKYGAAGVVKAMKHYRASQLYSKLPRAKKILRTKRTRPRTKK
jgi:hypothetical protein